MLTPEIPRNNYDKLVFFMNPSTHEGAPLNPHRVILHDGDSVRFWADKFGCTKKQLEQAVQKVGSVAGAVRAELGRKAPLRPLRRQAAEHTRPSIS